MKHRYLSFAIVIITLFNNYGMLASTAPTQTARIAHTPENTVIMFDIDDVILKKPTDIVKKTLLNKWWPLTKQMFHWRTYWNVLPSIYQLHGTGAGAEAYRKKFEKYAPAIAKVVSEIADTKMPIDGTLVLINKLRKQGYELHITSNMGEADFKVYQDRYSDIFDHFTRAKVVSYSPDGSPVKKPNPAYYESYLKEYQVPEKPYRIFIDDKLKNVEAARKHGITSIQFFSPDLLERELSRLNIWEAPTPTPEPEHTESTEKHEAEELASSYKSHPTGQSKLHDSQP